MSFGWSEQQRRKFLEESRRVEAEWRVREDAAAAAFRVGGEVVVRFGGRGLRLRIVGVSEHSGGKVLHTTVIQGVLSDGDEAVFSEGAGEGDGSVGVVGSQAGEGREGWGCEGSAVSVEGSGQRQEREVGGHREEFEGFEGVDGDREVVEGSGGEGRRAGDVGEGFVRGVVEREGRLEQGEVGAGAAGPVLGGSSVFRRVGFWVAPLAGGADRVGVGDFVGGGGGFAADGVVMARRFTVPGGPVVPASAGGGGVSDVRDGVREALSAVRGSAVGEDLSELRVEDGAMTSEGEAAAKRERAVFMARRELGNLRRAVEEASRKLALLDSLLEKALGQDGGAG